MRNFAFLFSICIFFQFSITAQNENGFFPDKNLMTVGVYYYPEHWNPDEWQRDIENIAAMGFEFVHLAEFAWFKMEPQEGIYDFKWLDKVVNLCVENGMKVLMCTPSATTPTWMRVNYPETYIMNGDYIRGEHGTRGLHSIVNPKYRSFVKNIVSEMAERYGQNPHVIGWQIDNEPDAKPDYSPSSQAAFRTWLKNKYETIDDLNKAWGNAFWSMWYDSFEQVIIPNATLVPWWGNNPSALLDFKRYSADAQAEFLDFQASILRNNILPSQYITTNYTAVCPGSDPHRTHNLDFATFTAYPNGGSSNIGDKGFRLGNPSTISFASDLYRNVGGVTGIMELQPGSVNWGSVNPLLLPGTVRMWLWHNFASGGVLSCSYRYRQISYGTEQYHAGIVKKDGITPSPGGEDYIRFMEELDMLRSKYEPLAKQPKDVSTLKAAILWNHENYWSIDRQKQTYQWDAWGYPGKFQRTLHELGATVDVITETKDVSSYPLLIVPAYELVDSSLIQKWYAYANNGGNLIVTCRTAIKNRDGHFWEAETAAPISDLIGAKIVETDMMPSNVKGIVEMKEQQFEWNDWGDLIETTNKTEILATYENQFYKGTPAVIQRKVGKGKVTYIGVASDDFQLEKTIIRTLFKEQNVTTKDYPKGVFVNWRDGFYVAVNYSSNNYTLTIPEKAEVLIGSKVLEPAGVTVWQE